MSSSDAPFRRSYAMHGAIAAGGMATVHVGRLLGPRGFARRVAIKRLHPQLAHNDEIATMFAAEARLTARVVHANVVSVLDVVNADGELLLVMDYVHGESLSKLMGKARRAGARVPVPIVASVMTDVLHGLHAAHEATGEDGAPLRIVHRDVSPQNVLVGADGVSRVVDFGIAKAVGQAIVTRDGPIRGKIPYMAPEQLMRRAVDRRVDVFAAGVVLWEALAGRRLFEAEDDVSLVEKVLEQVVPPPSSCDASVPPALDLVVMRALERDPGRRFEDAREMAVAIETATSRASASAVADWVKTSAAESLAERQAKIDAMERDARDDSGEPLAPAVRAPFASVFLTDDAPTPALVASAPSHVAEVAPGPRAARPDRRIGAAVAFAMLLLIGLVLVVRARGQAPPVATATASPPASTQEVIVTASDPTTAPPDPGVVSSPVVAAPAKPPVSVAKGPPPARWCKVFDPDKGIFVMRSMRVSRCP
jgi:serine/threonine-protein kinase